MSKAREISNLLAAGLGSSVTVSDTAPSNPDAGDLWFNSQTLKMYVYYDDGTTLQWVITNAGGIDGADATATTYANFAAFPSSGNTTGNFAIALDTKALYMWDGTEWDRVYTGVNETPEWVTEPESEYILSTTPVNISVEAVDPEGFPITYSYDTNPTSQSLVAITNNNDGTFTASPNGPLGNFVLRIKATDGVISSARTTSILVSGPPTAIEYLAVGGGGAGGGWAGGGGGAGGVLTGTLSIDAGTAYSITIGAGGLGALPSTYPGTWYSGSNTSFHTFTAYGGGAGASFGGSPTGGVNGGSGGGASYSTAAGTGVAGQGYAGSSQSGSYYGGGGGGASAAATGSNGSDGIEWPTGSGNYYGGGGGAGGGYITAGAGGIGGGGVGGSGAKTSAQDGLANTGGGGGGAFTGSSSGTSQLGSGNGGSGVVIIRYSSIYLDAVSTTGTVEYTNANGYKTYKFTAGSGSITW